MISVSIKNERKNRPYKNAAVSRKIGSKSKKVAPLSIFSISNSRYFASEAAVRLEPDCETPKTL